jgi:hypothetical protein
MLSGSPIDWMGEQQRNYENNTKPPSGGDQIDLISEALLARSFAFLYW